MKARPGAPLRASGRVSTRLELTLPELRRVAARRGYTHVLTVSGPVALADFHPLTPGGVVTLVGDGMVQAKHPDPDVRGYLWPLMRPEVKPCR